MRFLDLTLGTPAENLAGDEALLEECEAGEADETLRFWESPEYFVTLGYANKAAREVDEAAAQELDIPILRRCSGGGTVLQGPGCLNYTLLLRIPPGQALQGVTDTNQHVMRRHGAALSEVLRQPVHVEGHTDLAIHGRKFSGNAQRRKQRFLLFHGTLLLDFDLSLMQRVLQSPPKQPEYRANRPHTDFVRNLHLPAATVKAALCRAWDADIAATSYPQARVAHLVAEKYSRAAWNLKF